MHLQLHLEIDEKTARELIRNLKIIRDGDPNSYPQLALPLVSTVCKGVTVGNLSITGNSEDDLTFNSTWGEPENQVEEMSENNDEIGDYFRRIGRYSAHWADRDQS